MCGVVAKLLGMGKSNFPQDHQITLANIEKKKKNSPGRFYVAVVIKLILVHILRYYDCELVDPTLSRSLTWRSTIIPREQTLISFKARI